LKRTAPKTNRNSRTYPNIYNYQSIKTNNKPNKLNNFKTHLEQFRINSIEQSSREMLYKMTMLLLIVKTNF